MRSRQRDSEVDRHPTARRTESDKRTDIKIGGQTDRRTNSQIRRQTIR